MDNPIWKSDSGLQESVRARDGNGTLPQDNTPTSLDEYGVHGQDDGAARAQGQRANNGGGTPSLDGLCNLMDLLELRAQQIQGSSAQHQYWTGRNGILSLDANSMDEDTYLQYTEDPWVQSQDDALDAAGDFTLPHQDQAGGQDMPELLIQGRSSDTSQSGEDIYEDYLQVPIPSSSTGIATFAYQRALRNRIRNDKLARGGDYDTRVYTPTFVHDCLMLPGSLANVLGKVIGKQLVPYDTRQEADQYLKASAEQIIRRMTPALLPGFRAHVHTETEQPCLIQSEDAQDYAHGMLIFGEGREGRDQIHQHYRPHAKRIKVQVEFDVAVPVLAGDPYAPQKHWVLERKKQWAHAWLWSNVRDFEMQFLMDLQSWGLEDYLAGEYAMHQALLIGCQQVEDYDGGESSDEGHEDESDAEKIDEVEEGEDTGQPWVIDGGFKRLEYERSDDAIGKW